ASPPSARSFCCDPATPSPRAPRYDLIRCAFESIRQGLEMLPARQCPGDLAYCLLMPLIPDLGKVAGDFELHTLVERDLGRTIFSDTVVKIGDRSAQRAGDLK